MLNQIKTRMENEFKRNGIVAEITFISGEFYSLFCENAAQFCKAKKILDMANQEFDSEDCDEEIGFFAYYKW